MRLTDRLGIISKKMMLDFEESGQGKHLATKGQNRESKLRTFLEEKLPFQYGIGTGEIVYRDGELSNQTDIIIYDKIKCPIFYTEESIIVPIDGVHGIIEVKSYLSKDELRDAASKIRNFKQNAPRDLVLLETRQYHTFQRPSRPFGIVFGYNLKGNSLESLAHNLWEINTEQEIVNNWINMIFVLNEGYMLYASMNNGNLQPLLETDKMVEYVQNAKEDKNDGKLFTPIYPTKEETLLWFYYYLNATLSRTPVVPVDIGNYCDSNLPPIIHKIL